MDPKIPKEYIYIGERESMKRAAGAVKVAAGIIFFAGLLAILIIGAFPANSIARAALAPDLGPAPFVALEKVVGAAVFWILIFGGGLAAAYLVYAAAALISARKSPARKLYDAKDEIIRLARAGDEIGIKLILADIGLSEADAMRFFGLENIRQLIAIERDPELKDALDALDAGNKILSSLRGGAAKFGGNIPKDDIWGEDE